MAGAAQDRPILALLDDDFHGQGNVPAAIYLDRETGTLQGHVCTYDSVRVLGQGLFLQLAQDNLHLARQMGGSVHSHIDFAGVEAHGGPNFLDQLLARLDTRDNDMKARNKDG